MTVPLFISNRYQHETTMSIKYISLSDLTVLVFDYVLTLGFLKLPYRTELRIKFNSNGSTIQ